MLKQPFEMLNSLRRIWVSSRCCRAGARSQSRRYSKPSMQPQIDILRKPYRLLADSSGSVAVTRLALWNSHCLLSRMHRRQGMPPSHFSLSLRQALQLYEARSAVLIVDPGSTGLPQDEHHGLGSGTQLTLSQHAYALSQQHGAGQDVQAAAVTAYDLVPIEAVADPCLSY
jgi:hypothetical protein